MGFTLANLAKGIFLGLLVLPVVFAERFDPRRGPFSPTDPRLQSGPDANSLRQQRLRDLQISNRLEQNISRLRDQFEQRIREEERRAPLRFLAQRNTKIRDEFVGDSTAPRRPLEFVMVSRLQVRDDADRESRATMGTVPLRPDPRAPERFWTDMQRELDLRARALGGDFAALSRRASEVFQKAEVATPTPDKTEQLGLSMPGLTRPDGYPRDGGYQQYVQDAQRVLERVFVDSAAGLMASAVSRLGRSPSATPTPDSADTSLLEHFRPMPFTPLTPGATPNPYSEGRQATGEILRAARTASAFEVNSLDDLGQAKRESDERIDRIRKQMEQEIQKAQQEAANAMALNQMAMAFPPKGEDLQVAVAVVAGGGGKGEASVSDPSDASSLPEIPSINPTDTSNIPGLATSGNNQLSLGSLPESKGINPGNFSIPKPSAAHPAQFSTPGGALGDKINLALGNASSAGSAMKGENGGALQSPPGGNNDQPPMGGTPKGGGDASSGNLLDPEMGDGAEGKARGAVGVQSTGGGGQASAENGASNEEGALAEEEVKTNLKKQLTSQSGLSGKRRAKKTRFLRPEENHILGHNVGTLVSCAKDDSDHPIQDRLRKLCLPRVNPVAQNAPPTESIPEPEKRDILREIAAQGVWGLLTK